MSYQVLARKWRPATFEQMVGQSHVLLALTNALTQQRLHHAYLFTGTRGVGKTSLARLFAKGLNCEKGVTASPCGVCGSCVEIAQGRFVDLIEVDAASRTKVDDTRELLDNVQYRPTRGRFKVYLIDEVHMLSRSSFNALLKTLEEPPEHVKFLLATTDPQKLPVTVLSRCLQFNLKSLTQQEIGTQLEHILTQEQLPFEQEALSLLSKAANGSMRDALSLTDQAIAFGGGTVMLGQVQSMLGSIDEQHVLGLLKALTDADIETLMQTCTHVLAYGADAQEVLRSLLELLHQITLTQFAPAAAQQSLYSAQIQAFAEQLMPEQVQLYYQILLTGRKDLAYAPDPKSGLEMALLRAVAFVPEKSVQRWQVEDAAKVSLPTSPDTSRSQRASSDPSADVSTPYASPSSLEKKTLESTKSVLSEQQSPERSLERATTDVAASVTAALDADDLFEDPLISASLQAEQQIILSQAQSQGFGLVETVAAPSASDERKDAAVIATNEASVMDAHNPFSQAPLDAYSADYPVGEFDHEYPQSHDYQTQVVDSAGFDGHEVDSFEFETAISDSAALSYSYSDNNTEHAATGKYQPAVTAFASSTAAISLDDDDILSQVLAARDSLLTDLDALSAKDGDEKKRSVEVKAKHQALAKPSGIKPATDMAVDDVASDGVTQANVLAEINFDDDFGAELDTQAHVVLSERLKPNNPTRLSEEVQPQHKLDPNDRPPWEEPIAKESLGAALELPTSAQAPLTQGVEAQAIALDVQTLEPQAHQSLTFEPQMLHSRGELQTGLVSPNTSEQALAKEAGVELATAVKVELQLEGKEKGLRDVSHSAAVKNVAAPESSASRALTQAVPITGHPLDLHWYKLMASLEIGGRVRQLAVNSICQQLENPLPLLLKPDQKHLAAQTAIEQLEQALTTALGRPRQVMVSVGSDNSRETPLDMRKRFHLELLQQAQQSLMADNNVQWLINRFGAELDNDTLQYPPELLSQRSGLIQSLPEIEA